MIIEPVEVFRERFYLVLAHILLHGIGRPTLVIDQLGPVIVVLSRSADIHHVVDATGATKQLSAGDMVNFSSIPFLFS
jgi:hypothetical protein